MKKTFIEFLIEQGDEQETGASIETMTPQELTKIARMKQSNPKMANQELIKKIRAQLRTEQDPKVKMALQDRMKRLETQNEEQVA